MTDNLGQEPAFPEHRVMDGRPYDGSYSVCAKPGLTKREWFAGMAMMGLCATIYESNTISSLVEDSFNIADAMLKEAEK